MNALNRIQWLHKYIVNMRYPNAGHLSERFGISHRQAQRDVESLRSDYGAPIAYSAEHRGFYYTEHFSLPAYTAGTNEFDYIEAVTGEVSHGTAQDILQMQIPYSAVLRIPDKLTRLEFSRFIVSEQEPGCYLCEFHSVEMFLSLIFASGADISVLKPDWLRRRLAQSAERVLRNNTQPNTEE